VTLTGWDGDALFNESPKPYFRSLFAEGRWARLATGMLGYAVSQRRIVPLTLRARLAARAAGAEVPLQAYPPWIEPGLEARLDLRGRWRQALDEPVVTHPIRPYAFRILASIMRASNFFEYSDAGVTGVALEHRHPLMDLRLQEYCLSLPPLPWCVKKEIVRRAMRGVLPEPVLRRPKSPLAGWPEMELLQRPEARWIDSFVPAPALAHYVDRSKIPPLCAQGANSEGAREARWRDLRPLSLSVWMRNLESDTRRKANRLPDEIAVDDGAPIEAAR
jgi:asparagine synthase (glutamine-hydrolysing)